MCPAATPWAIAGGVAAGALAEGGLEVYRESKTGEYDWRKILIKTLGGSLKGALASSPLKPLVTGAAVGATGAIEDYIYCLTCGETHDQALRSAAINGPIEGVTTGGLKFIGNAVANRVRARKLTKTNLESVFGLKSRGVGNSVDIAGHGNTGRTLPKTLCEQMAMHQVQSEPLKNAKELTNFTLRDDRWPAIEGWVKMESIVKHGDGTKTVIHFVYNKLTGMFDDFKFKY